MRRGLGLVVALCAACSFALSSVAAPSARAAGGNPVINDCQSNGRLTHSYTLGQLKHALAIMPASVKQYTDCFDVIQNGVVAAKGTGRSGGAPPGKSSGGSFLPTPVIVILVLLVLVAVTFGALAVRRRRAGDGPGAGAEGPAGADEPTIVRNPPDPDDPTIVRDPDGPDGGSR